MVVGFRGNGVVVTHLSVPQGAITWQGDMRGSLPPPINRAWIFLDVDCRGAFPLGSVWTHSGWGW